MLLYLKVPATCNLLYLIRPESKNNVLMGDIFIFMCCGLLVSAVYILVCDVQGESGN